MFWRAVRDNPRAACRVTTRQGEVTLYTVVAVHLHGTDGQVDHPPDDVPDWRDDRGETTTWVNKVDRVALAVGVSIKPPFAERA
ncbi:hypothetical protein D3C81_1669470 [compost metagenome]